MSEKWTNEQSEAINTRGCNLLVAAAAGSGKTAVLVQRIIKLIIGDDDKSVDIDKLLVMTFTNAAASEMRERLAIELSKALSSNPNSQRLQRQMVLLNKANISTIHSFCLQVIKNNFHKLDLDPVFRIGDETEILLLKQETIEELLEYYYSGQKDYENFISLIEGYGGDKSDDAIQEIIFDLYNFSMSLPWPEKWLTDSAEVFNVQKDFDFGSTIWGKIIFQNVIMEIKQLKNMMEKAIDIIDSESSIEDYRESFEKETEMLDKISYSNSLDELSESFQTVKFGRLKSIKNADPKAKESVQEIRNKVKKKVNEISKELLTNNNEDSKSDMIKLYPTMKCLVEMIKDFHEIFRKKKKERGIIDFNDIEHYCLELLCQKDNSGEMVPSETALEYRRKFEYVLVDEYQDCNMVQEVIMSMVSRKDESVPNLFMVGDVKQSIYRFRHGRPELFLEKYNTYSQSKDAASRKIMLFKNFRSKKGVIEGVNYIFNKIMSKSLGELDYNENEALNFGADYYYENMDSNLKTFDETIELNLIEKSNNTLDESVYNIEDYGDEELPLDKIQLEARVVSKRILDLMDYYVYDKNTKKYRHIEFRDIVILLRTTSKWSEVFTAELKNANIPVYADTSSGYFDTIEIKTMLSLLKIIDNPLQDVAMVSVLRSPIFGFNPEELIDLRTIYEGTYFYEEIKNVCEQNDKLDDKLTKKCRNFLSKLNSWREKSLITPIDKFVWYLYKDTGYYGYTGAMPGGVQRQANLRLLFQRARQFGETSFKGLFNFILFIERLRTSSGDMGSAKTLSENENVIRIMSIHKSKGLEFPVVILSGLGKQFNLKDMSKKILFHPELGLGPDFVDYKRRISYSTQIKEALKSKLTKETLSEEMRILYVAMTRAKEKLILTGTINDLQKEIKCWNDGIDKDGNVSQYYLISNHSFIRWIGAAVIQHMDCKKLRETCNIDFHDSYKHDSSWSVACFNQNDVQNEEVKNSNEEFLIEQYCSNKPGIYANEIERRLSYKYPGVELTKLSGKITVSEIKRRFDDLDEESENMFIDELKKAPKFLSERKLTASERGTAMHNLMRHINLSDNLDYLGIKSQVQRLVEKEIFTESQAESININRVVKFFSSDLGRRMLNSQNVNREVTFQIKVPASEVYTQLKSDEYKKCEIIVQGAIDCYFYEDDGIVIIDYKTDYVDEENKETVINKYRVQLDYYEKAVLKMTGIKVKAKYIYLFYTGEFAIV